MAATDKTLGALHEKLAQHFVKVLEDYDTQVAAQSAAPAPREGEDIVFDIMVGLTPALLGVMTKFLKDNDITCNNESDENGVATLKDKLAKRVHVGNVAHVDFAG